MPAEITTVEASVRLLKALAAAGVDPTRPQFSVIGNASALDRQIITAWIAEAYQNGYTDGLNHRP